MNFHIPDRESFPEISENFLLFSSSPKFLNFIYPGLQLCKVQQNIFSQKNELLNSEWAKVSNFQTWNRIYSEKFPLFQLFGKFRNFSNPGLKVCQVSGKSKKLFFFIPHSPSSRWSAYLFGFAAETVAPRGPFVPRKHP